MDKTCRRCEAVKPIVEFRKDSRKKDGFGSYCKPCSSEMAKEWQRRNPEKRKERDAAWYLANKERKKASDAKRLPLYRERKQELDRTRRSLDPSGQRQKWNAWYQANREHSLRYKRARQVIRRSQDADWKCFPESLAYVRLIASDPCVYCGATAQSVDHIVPVAQGGGGEWDNLAPACLSCNSSKQDTKLLAFLLRTANPRA